MLSNEPAKSQELKVGFRNWLQPTQAEWEKARVCSWNGDQLGVYNNAKVIPLTDLYRHNCIIIIDDQGSEIRRFNTNQFSWVFVESVHGSGPRQGDLVRSETIYDVR